MNLRAHCILRRSSEYLRSPLIAYIKFAYFLIFGIRLVVAIRRDDSRRLLVVKYSSYKDKPHVYESISRKLNSDVGLMCSTLQASMRNLEAFPIHDCRSKELVFWSDVQIMPAVYLRYYLKDISSYSVFQHGAYFYSKSRADSVGAVEWKNTLCDTFYCWTEDDRDNIQVEGSCNNVVVIGSPDELKRNKMKGVCFGTRGPEYFFEDLDVFGRSLKGKENVTVFFHPSYSLAKRVFFLLRVKKFVGKVNVGSDAFICQEVLTKSRSFADVAKKSGCRLFE